MYTNDVAKQDEKFQEFKSLVNQIFDNAIAKGMSSVKANESNQWSPAQAVGDAALQRKIESKVEKHIYDSMIASKADKQD